MNTKTDAAAIAKASMELFQRGDVEGAERLLAPVIGDLRADPAIQYQMGLIKKSQKKWEDAERCFRSAIAGALTRGEYYNELGLALQARGEIAEARNKKPAPMSR